MLANAAGIGGGAAIVPIMMLFGFTAKVWVALSNVVIFIGAVTRYAMTFNSIHPEKKATLIDYEIVILMMPEIMIGSFIGVQLNLIAPQAMILASLGLVLCFISYKTLNLALKMHKDEEKSIKELKDKIDQEKLLKEQSEQKEIELKPLNYCYIFLFNLKYRLNCSVKHEENSNNSDISFYTNKLKLIRLREMSHFQPTKIQIILSCLITLILISLIRKNIFSGIFGHISKWSGIDLFIWFIFITCWIIIVIFSMKTLKNEHDLKVKLNYTFVKSDIQWTNEALMKMSIIAISGGILSSFVGIGGGIIYNPVIIGFGVHPSVSGATGMYMVLLGTFATSFQFFLLGMLPYDYSIAFGLLVIFATFVGIYTVNIAMKKNGKPSYLVFLLSGVIIGITILMIIISIIDFSKKVSSGESLFSFKSYWG